MSFINDILSGVEKSLLGLVADVINENIGKKPTKDILPGDVEIVNITLLSQDQNRKYNLLAQVTGFEIYESILSPVLYGEMVVSDSIGLLQSFPIIGEEYVAIQFRTPKSPSTATYLMRVNQVKNKKVLDGNKRITYTLQLVSAEVIRNSARVVTKTYEDTISNVITSIIKEDLKTEKPVNIETTAGVEKGLITRMPPFKAIDFLRRRAVSTKYPSSSFVFFESRDGYKLTTIEGLMDKGQAAIAFGSTKEFFFDTARKESVKDVTLRNIVAYNQITFTDTISKVQTGGLTNEIQSFDLVTGNVKKYTYTDNVGSDKFKKVDKDGAGQNTTGFIREHGKTTAVKNIRPVLADKPDTQLVEKLAIQRGFANKITQNIVQIYIYGDSDIRIGDTIKCTFPAAVDAANNKGASRLDSGNYLVSKVRHIVTNSDRPQHMIALELIKGGLTETV